MSAVQASLFIVQYCCKVCTMNSIRALHPMTISQLQVMFTTTGAHQKQDISLFLKVPPAQVCYGEEKTLRLVAMVAKILFNFI